MLDNLFAIVKALFYLFLCCLLLALTIEIIGTFIARILYRKEKKKLGSVLDNLLEEVINETIDELEKEKTEETEKKNNKRKKVEK